MAVIKKAVSIIICCVVICGAFFAAGDKTGADKLTLTASAVSNPYANLPYPYSTRKTENGYEVTILDPNYYIDENGDAVIPEKIGNYPVTAIGGVFCSHELKSVFIPERVKSINRNINSNVYIAEPRTFDSIIDGETHVFGNSLFFDCPNLETVTVAQDNPVYHSAGNCIIDTQRKALVSGCVSSIIPDDGTVTRIDDFAFGGVGSLKNIYIPSSVESIGVSPFGTLFLYEDIGSADFEGITVSADNVNYHSAGNCLIETKTGRLVSGFKNSVIPGDGSVKSIGSYAFSGAFGLKTLSIPDSVTVIGEGAFCEAFDLESLTIGDLVKVIGKYAFVECNSIQSIIIADSVTEIGYAAFAECNELKSVSFGSGLQTIKTEEYAPMPYTNDLFDSSIKLESITVSTDNPVFHSSGNCLIETETKKLINGCKNSMIPDDGSVTTICTGAFKNCDGLINLVIPDSVTEIEEWCFNGSYSIERIDFGNGIKHIGERNFPYGGPESLPYEVYYNGTKEDWNSVVIDGGNNALLNANYHFIGDFYPADYSALDTVLATVPEDLRIYSDESVAALNEIINGIDRNLDVSNQATVDAYVDAVSNAIAALKLKEQEKPPIKPTIRIKGYVDSLTIDYMQSVSFTAITDNMPDGAGIVWFKDGKKAGTGAKLTVKEAKADYKVQAKIVDKSGKILSSSDTELVKVKTDFYSKIIAFFRMIFGRLLFVEQ